MGTSELIIGLIALLLGAALGWFAHSTRSAAQTAQLPVLRDGLNHAREELARSEVQWQARLEELHQDRDRLADAFASLSQEALERNTSSFIEQADLRFANREAAMKALVEPLKEVLTSVKVEVDTAEKERSAQHVTLSEQLRSITESSDQLRKQTHQLSTALKSSNVGGQWGEIQLRRIVEAAGMLRYVDFTEQSSVQDRDGTTQRPDMVVQLPGNKRLVLDAKAALRAYLEATEAHDPQMQQHHFKEHAKQLRAHVTALSRKEYWENQAGSPEFVIMFVPADPILSVAIDHDSELLEFAFGKNVVIATPSTLMALLRTIAFTWQQERVAEDAQKIWQLGRDLYKRLGTIGTHLTSTGKALNTAVNSFNRLNRSIDSQLITQARRFVDTQGIDLGELDTPSDIETHALPAAKPELFTQEDSDMPASPQDDLDGTAESRSALE